MGKPEGRNHFEDQDVDGRIMLKWIFEKWDGGTWTGSMWLRIGTGFECGNELSCSIKYGEFLEELRTC